MPLRALLAVSGPPSRDKLSYLGVEPLGNGVLLLPCGNGQGERRGFSDSQCREYLLIVIVDERPLARKGTQFCRNAGGIRAIVEGRYCDVNKKKRLRRQEVAFFPPALGLFAIPG